MTSKDTAKQNRNQLVAEIESEFKATQDWDKIKTDVAQVTGADKVYLQTEALATRIAREGYIIKPHIGRDRFTKKQKPSDIGLDDKNPAHKEFIDKHLNLGSKLLLPVDTLKRLDQIEGKIRRIVSDKYGIPTCNGSFVAYNHLEQMKQEIEQLKVEYFEIRDEILHNYESIKAEVASAYRKFATEILKVVNMNPDYHPTEEEIQKYVDSTMRDFPSKRKVETSFYVTLEVGVPTVTAELAEHEARLRLVREAEQNFKQRLAHIDRELREDIKVQQERERQRLLLEREQIKTQMEQEQAKQRAIEQAVQQARESYVPQMNQVFADLAGAVHGIVYDCVTKVAETIRTKGSLSPGSSKSLGSLLEKIKNLAIEHDPDVEGWMKKIKGILDMPSQRRNTDSIEGALNEIRTESAKVILDIGCIPRSLRDLRNDIKIEELEEAIREMPATTRQLRDQVSMEDMFTVDVSEPFTRMEMRKLA